LRIHLWLQTRQICRVFDLSQQLVPPPAAVAHDIVRLDRVWKELYAQQHINIRKATSTSFRYNSELVLDLSFEVWFRGGIVISLIYFLS
jgi:hypothetical protein